MARLPVAVAVWLMSVSALAAGPEPGTRFAVDPARLPAPNPAAARANPAAIVPRPPGATLNVAKGYRATLFADGLTHARNLIVLPDGGVVVAEQHAGRLTLLKDRDGDGRAETRTVLAAGLDEPFGLAVHGGLLWVADTEAVWRLEGGRRHRVTPPGALGDASGHLTRSLALAPDGRRFVVGIGSRSNVGVEAAPRATVQEFAADGSGQRTLATGLRNPVGLTFRPGTDELWTVVNERDGLGDELVPDYLTRVVDGAFYGWPTLYIGHNRQPGLTATAPAARMPEVLFRAHSAPLGLAFWHGDAYVGLHGSWNRSRAAGYFVARVPFQDGTPLGYYEVFASGFIVDDGPAPKAWGRPVGIAVGADDALYVADDAGQTVWRIHKE